MFRYSLFISIFFLSCNWTHAQDIVQIERLNGEIVFDGRPDEASWLGHEPFPLVMHMPLYKGSPTEETDIRIGYDGNFLYVGANLYYDDISLMADKGKKRDYAQPSCDWFGIHLDTYCDRQNALLFYTNPNGLRFDAAVKSDFQSFEQDANFSWNTYWEVKTTQDQAGWYAEFKIPLSSLRFQESSGQVLMGLTIVRFMPAKNEMLTYPDISPEYNQATWKPSLAGTIAFNGLQSKKPLYISPYILGGLGQETALNSDETAYVRSTEPKYDAGLDVKMGVSNNLTLDLTLNTDFAQVEADDQQINLTRFSLFFPEKRVFFQEKSDVFDFKLGGPNNLFYSRRIGLYDGEPVRILGGLRMTGRAGKWDIGLLDMQTASILEQPSENFGVVRLKRTVFNAHSYIGGMVTSRIDIDGGYNLAYGFDGTIRVMGDEYFSLRLAQTADSDIHTNQFSHHPSRAHISWQRRGDKGLGYDLTLSYSGVDFNPEMGFEVMDNYQALIARMQYGWYPDENSALRKHKLYFQNFTFRSLDTKSLQSATFKTGWLFETRSGMIGDFAHHLDVEALVDTLEFDDNTFIKPGRYTFNYLSADMMLAPTSPVLGMIQAEAGQFYDGWKVSTTLMPTWSVGPSFDLSGTYRIDWVSIPKREMKLVNHIVGIKTLLTFTTTISIAGFIQYNTAIESIMSNIRFRYNPREGVDFYLVYNEGLNSYPYRYTPNLPVSDSRTIMAKFTYTLGL